MAFASTRRKGSHQESTSGAPTPIHGRDVDRDLAHASTEKLLETYWAFVQSPFAGVAAMMVSTLGESQCAPVVNGELRGLMSHASALQKAHGKNITPTQVSRDLDVAIPSGFIPTFDLYLRAAGIKPDTGEDRAVARTITTAIRRKIREVRALNAQAAE